MSPSGIIPRKGKYTVKTRLVDDDNNKWLDDFEWGEYPAALAYSARSSMLTPLLSLQDCQGVVNVMRARPSLSLRESSRERGLFEIDDEMLPTYFT